MPTVSWTGIPRTVAYPEFVTVGAELACADVDPELFFPGRGEPNDAAMAVCRRCKVREACLEDALDGRQEHGIWGGTTPGERLKILRARARA